MNTGGEGGIRTLGTLAGTTVFETAPIDRSGTSPRSAQVNDAALPGLGWRGTKDATQQPRHDVRCYLASAPPLTAALIACLHRGCNRESAVLSMSRTSRVGICGMKVWNSRNGVSARQRRRNPGQDGAEQAVPGQEEMVGGYGPDVLEQARTSVDVSADVHCAGVAERGALVSRRDYLPGAAAGRSSPSTSCAQTEPLTEVGPNFRTAGDERVPLL